MIILTCRTSTKERMTDLYVTLENLTEVHPQIKAIIDQVKASRAIDKLDKSMIVQQLISMAATLNEAKTYTLALGRWRTNDTYSAERERASREEKTIRDETIFTIVAYSRAKNWTAFVDLPIDIDLPEAKEVYVQY